MSSPHDKIIATAAKAELQSLGLRRKGQSRLWIGDRGWWLLIVEFQPSGYSKGSYLNVAAHWLWKDQDYISFDMGSGVDQNSRVSDFEAYGSDRQFEVAATKLAKIAAQEASALDGRLTSIREAAQILLNNEAGSHDSSGSWSTYNAGVAAGLAGCVDEAKAMLLAVTDARVKATADHYASLALDLPGFKALALSTIAKRREALRLPAMNASPF